MMCLQSKKRRRRMSKFRRLGQQDRNPSQKLKSLQRKPKNPESLYLIQDHQTLGMSQTMMKV
jgi:hypothetical protein